MNGVVRLDPITGDDKGNGMSFWIMERHDETKTSVDDYVRETAEVMDKTLHKGLTLLEALVRSDGARGVTELAAELGLEKSNAHRVLKTLEAAGYVRSGPLPGRYLPSLKMWELGCIVIARLDLKQQAAAQLKILAEETRETVHLSILSGAEVIYVDKIDSPEPVRSYTTMGGRAPAYAVATGKAMLAHQGTAMTMAVAATMQPFTPRTIRTAEELDTELLAIRKQGFAINRGEWRESVYGLAAPIWSPAGVIAAIGISGPASRLKLKALRDLSKIVVQAAASVSESLGHIAASPGTPVDGTTYRMAVAQAAPL